MGIPQTRPSHAVAEAVSDGTVTGPVAAPHGPNQEERLARAWLSRASEPGNRQLWASVVRFGAVVTAARLRAGDGREVLQVPAGPGQREDRSIDDLQAAERLGIRLVIPGDDEWPSSLVEGMALLAAAGNTEVVPPIGLWVRGEARLDETVERSVAIVGSRASTGYGDQVAADLAQGLVRLGYTVVSGGAFGIDAAAHRGALSAEGRTVAVLAGGLDRPRPRGNGLLFERIMGSGLLLSELPPGFSSTRRQFVSRNRIIAGLAAGTVVVEAAPRSGIRSTASRTLDLGKPLMAVPGPVTSVQSVGCLDLIRMDGVRPVGSAEQILEEVDQR